jgi:hypothetical protein
MRLVEVALVVSIVNGCAALGLTLVQLADRWRRRRR